MMGQYATPGMSPYPAAVQYPVMAAHPQSGGPHHYFPSGAGAALHHCNSAQVNDVTTEKKKNKKKNT